MIKLPIPSLEGLTSERLRFRRVTPADVDVWMPYIESPEAVRFMGFTPGSRSDCVAMIQRSLDRYVQTGSGLNMLERKDTGEPVGKCGLLVQEVDGATELEIGYHLLPAHWHQGYASEAARACRDMAFRMELAPSLVSLIDPGNTASQRVAQRNGMAFEKLGRLRDMEVQVYRIHRPS
jgi:RimJ/RimL family protein N-acetyltransferase